ncbi:transcription factor bHLH128-like [Primulina huaijiensis]|uniref:transcription factor bHLH128-like n=1 Tax=Primulina huaijiensis TaxID=1492673 RepID=UPI003CC72F2F
MIPTHMYPSSTSSSSQGSMGLASSGGGGGGGGGLMRYGSAPSSFLASSVDSSVAATREFSCHSHLSAAGRSQTDSFIEEQPPSKANSTIGLQRAYGFGVVGVGSSCGDSRSPSLVRHSSSPAGFLNQIAATVGDSGGFSVTRGMGNYNNSDNLSRLNSQLSFTRQDSTLSYISEENKSTVGDEMRTQNGKRNTTHSYGSVVGYGMGTSTWDETNSVMFTVAPNKRNKIVGGGDLLCGLDSMENQFQFSMGQGGVEMTQMEKLIHNIPQDSVSCKIRAKRGCATHPRSIAERERRTKISGKLKKLQILVPNMDKQTSYSDMLDLAVQHIKSLQNQVQKLHQELEDCTCGCKTKDL